MLLKDYNLHVNKRTHMYVFASTPITINRENRSTEWKAGILTNIFKYISRYIPI